MVSIGLLFKNVAYGITISITVFNTKLTVFSIVFLQMFRKTCSDVNKRTGCHFI